MITISSRLLILVTLMYGLNSTFVFGQEKWGKVSPEILAMTTFPQDSSTEAIILFDVAKQEITNEFLLEMNRHVRIKILTEKGKEFASVKIPYWQTSKVKDVKAQTILPNMNKVELSKKDIFEESIGKNWKQKVFTIPGVEVGSVIEYQYEMQISNLIYLQPWYFQNRGYTVLSQMSITLSPHFNYNVFYQNVFGEQTKPQEEEILIPGVIPKNLRKYTWKMENIPSLAEEAYVANLDDYRMAMFFQLIEYRDPYYHYEFIKEWEDLAKELNEEYKDFLTIDAEVRNKASSLLTDSMGSEDKMKTLFNFVRDEIETEALFTIFPQKTPGETIRKARGNRAEKNMLLIAMLRQAGFEANPLLISTRSHGQVKYNWPYILQFNHLIAFVVNNSQQYFLDAGEKYCPFGVLPSYALVEDGFLLTAANSRFQKIPQSKNLNMWTGQTFATLTAEGALSCSTEIRFEGYEAMKKREEITGEEHRKYLEKWLKNIFAQAVLDTYYITQLEDREKALTIQLTYQLPDYGQVVGENIYLTVPQLSGLYKNPFRKFERKIPLEYNYLTGTSEKIILTVPEGFIIEDVPLSKNSKIDGMIFLAENKPEGNHIVCHRQFMVKKKTFNPSEYQQVKDFYSQMISYAESQIVIKRKP